MWGVFVVALVVLPACGGREPERSDAILRPSVEPLVAPVLHLDDITARVPPAAADETLAMSPERAELERAARALGGRLSAEGVIEPPLQDEDRAVSTTAGDVTPRPTAPSTPDAQDGAVAAPIDVQDTPVDVLEPVEDAIAATVELAAESVPVPWLQQYQTAYAARQIARSDLTTQLSSPSLGVYFEDFRTVGAQVGTPHRIWLGGAELQVVSPALEALLVSQGTASGAPPTFVCDASSYACRSVENGTQGVYFRFAMLGAPQQVRVVGALFYDMAERTAATNTRIEAFNRVIDARLRSLE